MLAAEVGDGRREFVHKHPRISDVGHHLLEAAATMLIPKP